jgi:hypothetical protein
MIDIRSRPWFLRAKEPISEFESRMPPRGHRMPKEPILREESSSVSAAVELRTIEEWCEAMGPTLDEATYEERRHLMRGPRSVSNAAVRDTPRYVISWDFNGLKPEPHTLDLPRSTGADVARIVARTTGSHGR